MEIQKNLQSRSKKWINQLKLPCKISVFLKKEVIISNQNQNHDKITDNKCQRWWPKSKNFMFKLANEECKPKTQCSWAMKLQIKIKTIIFWARLEAKHEIFHSRKQQKIQQPTPDKNHDDSPEIHWPALRRTCHGAYHLFLKPLSLGKQLFYELKKEIFIRVQLLVW